MHRKINAFYSLLLLLVILTGRGSTSGQYISADTYTRYELLAPETHQFKIYYEVTETRVGARYHFNQIREGSDASDESVLDLATGRSLKFEVVTGAPAARAAALFAPGDHGPGWPSGPGRLPVSPPSTIP